MSIIINNYIARIPHQCAMVFRWLRTILRSVRDYVHDLYKTCQGYDLCITENCEYYVHLDEPMHPVCRHCYCEQAITDLADYVMEYHMQNDLGQSDQGLRSRS